MGIDSSMDALQLVSRSTTPIVSLDDAKAHCRVVDTNSDTYITALIEIATQQIEKETNCDLRSTIWEWVGNFPHPRWHTGFYSPFHAHDFVDGYYRGYRHKMMLPRCPLQSVNSITYYDADNVLQTFTSDNYYVMTPDGTQGWIQPALFWPATYDAFRPDAVTINFTSGYGITTNPCPAIAQHAVKLAVGTWFENRESETEARLNTLGLGYQRLIDQLTITGVVG